MEVKMKWRPSVKFVVVGTVFTFLLLYGLYISFFIYGFRIWDGHPEITDPSSVKLYWNQYSENPFYPFETCKNEPPLVFDKNTAIQCGNLINQGKVLGQLKQGMDCELEFLFENSEPIRYEFSFQGYARHDNAYTIKVDSEAFYHLLLSDAAQPQRSTPASVNDDSQKP